VRMWDKNQLIVDVDPLLASRVKKNDVVLVDYSPMQVGGQAVPKQNICKILSRKLGEKLWKDFLDCYEERNKKPVQPIVSLPELNHAMVR
ncbi:MAG: hypothetical protein HY917_01415, partial [Candidatus Diapherotrites archaeon]|nr:hypothetical protein [Candidatus Diapherotrites archaeon]